MRRITSIVVSVCLLLSFSTLTTAQEKSGEVLVRVLDVGAAHASIIRVATPDKSNPAKQQHRYFLYDTGFYDQPLEGATAHGDTAVSAKRGIEEFIPKGSEIDLLVESHSHSDHIGATTWVLQNYKVKRTLRTGFNYASPNETAEFKLTDAAIRQKVKDDKDFTDTCLADLTKDHEKENPAEYPWIGKQIAAVNGMTLTIVSGFGKPLPAWEKAFSEAIDKNIIPFRPRAEWDEATKKQRRQSSLDGYRLNSVSIVVRLDYAGHSVLFTGDEIGKYFSSPDDVSVAAEAFMLSNKDHVSIDTDVLIAGHHGADNSSSLPFVKAVSPDYVIFPAGHMHGHRRRRR
jgi:beta-lactamase superfamily II metal-dependent hydrolase